MGNTSSYRQLFGFLLIIAICFFAISSTNIVIAQESNISGDITQDGVVDGRDALKIMRVVDGFETATESEILRGDVYPLPGLDGRRMGDGKLTREDAYKILQKEVGLIPPGELSGDYTQSQPAITDFSPRSGSIGTRVTLEGKNFVSALGNENVVYFGGMQAPILQMSGTRIMTEVPAGAQSAPIRLRTPGGNAESSGEFFVTTETSGKLQVGNGLNPADFIIVNRYGEAAVSADGSFDIPVGDDGVNVLGAASNSAGNNTYMCILTDYDPNDVVIIDAESTAKSLILMHPFFFTRDKAAIDMVFSLLDALPEYKLLINVVDVRYSQGADGLEDPEVNAVWSACITALLKAMPQALVKNVGGANQAKTLRSFSDWNNSQSNRRAISGTGSSAESVFPLAENNANPTVKIYGVDRLFIDATYSEKDNSITPKLDNGYSPLDWIVALYRLHPDALPQGLNTPFTHIQSHGLKHAGYCQSTMLAANQWTAKIDILRTGVDSILGEMFDWMKSNDTLYLEDREQSAYILRIFSGSIRDFEGWDDGAINTIEDGPRMARSATIVNLTLSLIDLWSLVGGDEAGFTQEAIKSGFKNGFTSFTQQSGGAQLNKMSEEQAVKILFNVLIEIGKGIAVAAVDEGISQAQQKLQGTLLAAVKNASVLLKSLSMIANVGKIAERVAGLMGYLLNPLDMEISPGPTPLETMLVMVGDPYDPVLYAFSPESGGENTEVTLSGKNFAINPKENVIMFGDKKAEVVSGDTESVIVKVPAGILGSVAQEEEIFITIETPASNKILRSKSSFKVLRTPVINSMEPIIGYGASPGITEGPYANFKGTQIRLTGYYMQPLQGYKDYVAFVGGKRAEIVYQNNNYMDIMVPELTPDKWDVSVADPNTGLEVFPGKFTVLGKPDITSCEPKNVQAGELIEIKGANFHQAAIMIGDEYITGIQHSNDRILIRFPSIGEPDDVFPLKIYNPAGETSSILLKREAGIEVTAVPSLPQGFTFKVTTGKAGDVEDGKLSLDEVNRFINKEYNILERDDKNQKSVEIWYQRRNAEGELYWKFSNTITENPDRENNGPDGHEIHYMWERRIDIDKNVSETLKNMVDLDEFPADMEEADYISFPSAAIPDYDTFYNTFDANQYQNTINILTEETVVTITAIKLSNQDKLITPRGLPMTIYYGISVGEGCSLELGAPELRQPITFTGSSAILKSCTISLALQEAIIIDNGFGNTVYDGVVLVDGKANGIVVKKGGANVVNAAILQCAGNGVSCENSEQNQFENLDIRQCANNAITVKDGKFSKYKSVIISDCESGVHFENCIQEEFLGSIIDCKSTAFRVSGGSGNSLYQVNIQNCGEGLVLTKTKNNIIRWMEIEDCTGDGLHMGPDCSYHQFEYYLNLYNNGNGLVLEGEGTHSNSFDNSNIGIIQNDDNTWSNGGNALNGIKIIDGANRNTFSSARISANLGHGVMIDGKTTHSNKFWNCSIGYFNVNYQEIPGELGNGENGVLIQNGAHHNAFDACYISDNGENGVFIQGAGSDFNQVINCKIGSDPGKTYGDSIMKPNQGIGIFVDDGPKGTIIKGNDLCLNIKGGIVISKVQEKPDEQTPSVTIEDNNVKIYPKTLDAYIDAGYEWDSIGTGIKIDHSSNIHLIHNYVSRFNKGLHISGANTGNHYLNRNYISKSLHENVLIEFSENDTIETLSAETGSDNAVVLSETIGTIISGLITRSNKKNGLIIEKCQDIVLEDGIFNNSSDESSGIIVDNSEHITLREINMNSVGKKGIHVFNESKNVLIDDIEAGFCGESAIVISKSSGVEITGLPPKIDDGSTLVTGVHSSKTGAGIVIEDSQDIRLGHKKYLLEISRNTQQGVLITGDSTQNVEFINCYIHNNGEEGIRIEGGKSISIGGSTPEFGNHIERNGKEGILAQGSETGLSITNSVIGSKDFMYYGINEDGIVLQDGIHHVLISGNSINGSYNNGIIIRDGAHHNFIGVNEITVNRSNGVLVEGGSSLFNQITRNNITRCGDKAINLSNGGNNSIEAPEINYFKGKSQNISGHIDAPDGSRIEIYSTPYKNGESLIGTAVLRNKNFYATVTVPEGKTVSGIIIHPDGNTSEFGSSITHLSPASPSGGDKTFVYTSDQMGDQNIYIVSPSSNMPVQLTSSTAMDNNPELSPFQSDVIFVSNRTGNRDLWVMSRDGNEKTLVTSDPADDYQPSWKPGSDQVAFTSERDGNPEIYMTTVDTNAILGEISYGADDPSTYNDPYTGNIGDAIGVHFSTTPGLLSHFSIYIAADPVPFAWQVLSWENGQPGQTILAQDQATPSEIGWNIVETDNIPVPEDYVISVSFLQEGKPQIALANGGQSGRWWTYSGTEQVWSYKSYVPFMIHAFVKPMPPQRITNNDAADMEPCWSSNGNQIVFTSDRGGNLDLWIMDADGANPRQLTDGIGSNTNAAWCPYDDLIAFVSDRNGNPDIYTIRSNGSELTQRTTHQGVDINPVWDSSNFMLLISSDRDSGMEIYSMIFGSNRLNRLSVDSGDSIEPHVAVGSGQSGKVLAAKTRYRPYSNQPMVDIPEAQASINQGEGEPGDIVSLEIKLEGAQNLGNLAFDVLFDRSQLILADMTQGDLLLDSLFALNPEIVPADAGMMQFNWVKSSGFTGDSQIMTLELEIKRQAGLEEVPVSFRDLQAFDLNLNEISISGLDGLVTINGNSTDVKAWMLFE